MGLKRGAIIFSLLLLFSYRYLALKQWTGENEGDDLIEAYLKEEEMTIADVGEFYRKYGGAYPIRPRKTSSDACCPADDKVGDTDDLLFGADRELRYRRAAETEDPAFSGQDNPCDTNTSLCNDTGQVCEYDTEQTVGYRCDCQKDYDFAKNVCVAIPDSRKLYLTTGLEHSYDHDYHNYTSVAFAEFTRNVEDALSQEFSGLESFKTLRVLDLRDDNNHTVVVYALFFLTNTSTAIINSVATQVMTMEDKLAIVVGNQQITLWGLTGIFHTLSDTQTSNDAVDWCSATDFQCNITHMVCKDVGFPTRYVCVCKAGYVDVNLECVDEREAQIELFPYGENASDHTMRRSNDDYEAIDIDAGLSLGNSSSTVVYVAVNGLISFNTPSKGLSFNLDGTRPMLCPYLSDISTLMQGEGDVFYHRYNNRTLNKSIFNKTDQVIGQVLNDTFDAKLVLVVTWHKVAHVSTPQPTAQTEYVTFQVVLTSDGTVSYALVIYKTGAMKWHKQLGRKITIGLSRGPGFPLKKNFYSGTTDPAIDIDRIVGNTGRRGMWLYELGEAYSPDAVCSSWYNQNAHLSSIYFFLSLFVPWCPCSMDFLTTSIWFGHRSIPGTDIMCFRPTLVANPGTSSRECCYRESSRSLVQDTPHAGSFLPWNPPHFVHKVQEIYQMHDVCCYQSNTDSTCRLYYALYPIGLCLNTAFFRITFVFGDPHVKTLDGKEYTFNGLGEYTMLTLQTVNHTFTLQGRTDKALNDNGTAINATIFSAFALSDGNVSVTVEMEPTNRSYMIINVEEASGLSDFTVPFQQSPNFRKEELAYGLERQNNSLVVSFKSGISVTITLGVQLLDIGLSVPSQFKGLPKGLMGNYNDDPDDDFVLANDTVLNPNMTDREIFVHFGQSWAISAEESIFRYDHRKGPADYQHPDFVPIFLDEVSSEDQAAAKAVCGGDSNLACIYDYVATGSQAVAQATKDTKNTAEETDIKLKNTAPTVSSNGTIMVSQGQTVTLQLNASDEDGDPLIFHSDAAASGTFSLDNITGEVNYTLNTPDATDNLGFFVKDTKQASSPVIRITVVYCPNCSLRGECDTSRPRPANSSQTFIFSSCKCQPWYEGDDCEHDFDGCADNPCIAGQNCTDMSVTYHRDNNISYNCSACPTGYSAVNGKCKDVDECSLESDNQCVQNCENTDGSYTCSCQEGYRLSDDKKSCDDINECADKSASCQQICINTVGGYNCSCEEGYDLEPTNNTCSQSQAALATCENLNCTQGCRVLNATTPQCFCRLGYVLNTTDNTSCDDDDECDLGICSQQCANSVGSFQCSCYAGYKLASDRTSCEPCSDLTYGVECSQRCECSGHGNSCHPVTGCMCEEGWRGERCQTDVDECVESPGICSKPLQKCVNTDGSYRCVCLPGYTWDAATSQCKDKDECAPSSTVNTCGTLENCENTMGSFYCTCRQGYYRDGDDCKDIDECKSSVATCQQNCINNAGSYACECRLGFRLAADRKICESAEDVCANTKSCEHFCTLDDDDQPYCFCRPGYRLNSDFETCTDEDECKDGRANCSHVCTNQAGSFLCSCPVGFKLGNDKRTCSPCETGTYGKDCSRECACGVGSVRCDRETGCDCSDGWTGSRCDQDINECDTVSVAQQCAAQNAKCENFPGGYRCVCQTGYEKNANASDECEDINECKRSSPCGQKCENNPGSYQCLCNAGFTFSSVTNRCEDQNECAIVSLNRCTQKCVNTEGSYRCTCDEPGFILANDGYTCKGETECNDPTVCPTQNGGCVRNVTSGNDTCFCYNGFQLDQSNACVLEEKDWCGEAACAQQCANTTKAPYFQCSCTTGFQLNDDGRTCRECASDRWGVNCSEQCTCNLDHSRLCVKDNGTCLCEEGWTGANCTEDIEECDNSSLFSCVPNSKCENTAGGYVCVCDAGFFKADDGNCSECSEGFYDDCNKKCACNQLNTQTCNKVDGTCTCNTGWKGDNCSEDISECADDTHNCTGQYEECQEADGSFSCICQSGFVYNSSGQCIDQLECLDKSHNCSENAICENTVGAFSCACRPGYSGDGFTCQECDEGKFGMGCNQTCTCNATGTASCNKVNGTCSCKGGYAHELCDVRACQADTYPCPANSSCMDTEDNYTCTCNPGFNATGENCTDIDECEDNSLNTCNQTCSNTVGSFTCSCGQGYQTNGTECQDIDECGDSSLNTCNQTCSNTVGSFTCSCGEGYLSNGTECQELRKVAFSFAIDVSTSNLSTTLADKNSTAYNDLRQDVEDQTFDKLNDTVPGLQSVRVTDMRQGSLIVDAEAEVNPVADPQVIAFVSKALVDLKDSSFNIDGQQGNVSDVKVNNQSVSDVCSVYQAIAPCSTDEECAVNTGTGLPFCRELKTDETDYKMIIGLAVGVPLFVIVVIVIIALVYINVRGRYKGSQLDDIDDDQSQVSAVFARKIATRGDWHAGSMMSPECRSVSSVSSDEDQQRGRMRGVLRPDYDTSVWSYPTRATGDNSGPSHFSWDFLYHQMGGPSQPFVIKRPQIAPQANPTYDNPRFDSQS